MDKFDQSSTIVSGNLRTVYPSIKTTKHSLLFRTICSTRVKLEYEYQLEYEYPLEAGPQARVKGGLGNTRPAAQTAAAWT